MQVSKEEIPEKYKARLCRLSTLVLEIIKYIVMQDTNDEFVAVETQQNAANFFGRSTIFENRKFM
jgi:hypothetical protein